MCLGKVTLSWSGGSTMTIWSRTGIMFCVHIDIGTLNVSHCTLSAKIRVGVEFCVLRRIPLFYPAEADAADGVWEHVSNDGRVAVGGREVSVKLRVVPVRHARHDNSLQISHHRLPTLAFLRCRLRNQRTDVARLYLGKHAPGSKHTLHVNIEIKKFEDIYLFLDINQIYFNINLIISVVLFILLHHNNENIFRVKLGFFN